MQVFEEDYSEVLDDNAIKYLQSVKNATKRMSDLIRSLLAFSKLGHNKVLARVDGNKLISDVLADLEAVIQQSNALIEVGEMPMMSVYEPEIRQVFQNLVTNAIKFRKKGQRPEIKIHSCKIETGWKFLVSDNGIGIAPIYFDRIFEIFQRLKTSEQLEGSGIGLANCKKIIQMHQGEIRVESTPGGTTFYFTISNQLI